MSGFILREPVKKNKKQFFSKTLDIDMMSRVLYCKVVN